MADDDGIRTTSNAFKDDVVDDNDPPSAKFINWFLANADTRAVGSLLHRLGFAEGDAASGRHTHDGKDSLYLFAATPALSPIPANATSAQQINAINAIIQHLNSRGAGLSQ